MSKPTPSSSDSGIRGTWRKFILGFGFGFVFVTVAVLLFPVASQCLFGYEPAKNVGEFGDQFGAVNAWFSGLAFAGVIITLALQMRELQYQRQEIDQTQDIMERQSAEMARQAEFIDKQAFENSFFKMLDLLRSVRDDARYSLHTFGINSGKMAIMNNHSELLGLTAFENAVSGFSNYQHARRNTNAKNMEINELFLEFYSGHLVSGFWQYFKTLESLVVFVGKHQFPQSLNSDGRQMPAKYSGGLYSSVIRAQLSRAEAKAVALYCLLLPSDSVFLDLIREYQLLTSVDRNGFYNESDFDDILT